MREIVEGATAAFEASEDARLMDENFHAAFRMMTSEQARTAFDLSREPESVRERYGMNRFGQCCLLARRLVEAGSVFVTAAGYHGTSWDTHSNNDVSHRDRLCPPLDRTLVTLVEDLEERGLLDSTLVIAMGEFGRTPNINPNLGRDHWPNCWSLALAGGGIKTGQAIGTSDERGANVTSRVVSMGDLYATVYKLMGVDWTKEIMSPIGRPIKIANSLEDKTGEPVKELLG